MDIKGVKRLEVNKGESIRINVSIDAGRKEKKENAKKKKRGIWGRQIDLPFVIVGKLLLVRNMVTGFSRLPNIRKRK